MDGLSGMVTARAEEGGWSWPESSQTYGAPDEPVCPWQRYDAPDRWQGSRDLRP